MTISEKEIWTAANQTIQQHGDEAENHALQMMTNLLIQKNDADGHEVWKRIGNAATASAARTSARLGSKTIGGGI